MHIAHPLLAERQIYKITGAAKVISFRQQDPAVVTKTTPTLVFLHGFNGNSASWKYQFSYFQSYRVLSIDSPGFGETSVFEVCEMAIDTGAQGGIEDMDSGGRHGGSIGRPSRPGPGE